MKKLFFLSILLFAIVYMGGCDGQEDDSGILIIKPVDSTQTALSIPE